MLIAVAGAPGSGKSVAAAEIYAALHLLNAPEPRYVPEYAHKYFGKGYTISNVESQMSVTETQEKLEQEEIDTGGKSIVCDSALWIGYSYMEILPDVDIETAKEYYKKFNHRYDLIFYAPLTPRTINQLNDFRIHDYEKSVLLDHSMTKYVQDHEIENVFVLPKEYFMREAFIRTKLYEILRQQVAE